jgi:predicted aminopeptidase
MLTARGLARAALIVLAVTLLPACGTMYLAQAARGQWQVMNAREPIDAVLAREGTPEALRARLVEVKAARAFASRELGLPDNGSYRTYADLKRPYVVWNVVATPEFSVEPQRWCFPIAGCVAYRGYFSQSRAESFANALRRRGMDVIVGGVPAYSTLGRLSDPVLNTMLGYGDTELAAIIFHELSHQVVYVAGDSEFNEAFATTVEQAGVERWLKLRGREEEYRRYKARHQRQQRFITLFARTRQRLAELYARKMPAETMREHKRAIFSQLESDIGALEAELGVTSGYSAWIKQGLNNAHLASVATYYDCVPGFERLLERHNGDLQDFYAAVRELAALPRAQRHAQLCGKPTPPPSDPTGTPAAEMDQSTVRRQETGDLAESASSADG